jgi:hypothetical protein
MNRMNLDQIVQYLFDENYIALAMDFSDFGEDSKDVVDGMIDVNAVKSYMEDIDPSGRILRQIQSNVTTYIGCDA